MTAVITPGRSPSVLGHDDGGVGQGFTNSCQKGSRTGGGAFLHLTLLYHQKKLKYRSSKAQVVVHVCRILQIIFHQI